MSSYAIIQHGGKQYRVVQGDTLLVERAGAIGAGDALTFDRVLLVGDGEAVSIGTPVVAGATVKATVLAEERGPKVRIFKKKRRKGYRRTNGHRQNYLRVSIDAIEA